MKNVPLVCSLTSNCNFRLPYESIFGGVGAFKKADFQKVNGFSNLFWGWGGEDDDLFARYSKPRILIYWF